MISSFTVGSIFRIVDEASPALRLILRQVRELNVAIDKARQNLASIGRGSTAALGVVVGETQGSDAIPRELDEIILSKHRHRSGHYQKCCDEASNHIYECHHVIFAPTI
jgi:hypothetical protein